MACCYQTQQPSSTWRGGQVAAGDVTWRLQVRRAMNAMQYGLQLLQRGRVLVTDRLHGHILSTLLGVPHVLLDNQDQKLSSFHNTWTRGLRLARVADTPQVGRQTRWQAKILPKIRRILVVGRCIRVRKH